MRFDLEENKKGFWNVMFLVLSCNMVIGGTQEILHQLVLKEYLLSSLIFIITVIFFYVGVSAYGEIKEQLK